MPTRRQMTRDELAAQLDAELSDSVGYMGSELTKDRAKALDYYYGRKVGILKGEDGRSQVVDRTVLETIESVTAQLMQMFEGEQLVQFDPTGPEDVPQAEQETEYVNYVLQKDNEGFQITHDWLKDGLLSRVGVVHVGWCDEPRTEIESYTGLQAQELELLLSDEGSELVEKTERTEQVQGPDGQTQEVTVCDARIRVERKGGRVEVCCIPPEEFRISRGVRVIEEIRRKPGKVVAHCYETDEDGLKEAGFTPAQIERILGSDDETDNSIESLTRDNPQDIGALGHNTDRRETAWVSRCYSALDWDSDGKPELREIYFCAKEIGSNEPVEEIPYADWCPVPMPHRFSGQSYADLVLDLQEIRTALKRQMLDNLYLANNPMKEVVDGQVNFKDLLTARIGGVVRSKQIGSVREMVVPAQIAPSLEFLTTTESDKENRTGISRAGIGLDPDLLKGNVPHGNVAALLSQQAIRLKMVARLFAERGMKRLMRLVHGIIRRHQDFARVVRLRNQFVQVDPREWRERMDLTATVGLGHGTKQEQLANLNQILGLQMNMLQLGVTAPPQVYYTLGKITEAMGYKNAQSFWTQPQPPNPQEQMQKAQQAAQLQAMVEGEKEKAKAMGRAQGEAMKAQAAYQMKIAEIESRERTTGQSLQMDRDKAMADYQIKVAELQQANQHKALDFVSNVITHTHDKKVEREAMSGVRQ